MGFIKQLTYITGRPHLVCRYYTRMARHRVFPMTRLHPGLRKLPRLSLAIGDSQTGEKTYIIHVLEQCTKHDTLQNFSIQYSCNIRM